MSNNENHKKAIAITASCRGNKGALTAIYYKILEDHPAAIVNAFEKVKERHGESGVSPGYEAWHLQKKPTHRCPDCQRFVDKLGIAGACIKCDPSGFDDL